ncbi:hypothetical protein ASPCADRAFT_210938 [Aspergillus carbonarius ITEM 5010]|uniref:Uncharacterized protein n=1 Tax=Aspergillus carbonarius (strain ITEM 5010) TaxID=602072 RepID=A0A1R3RAR2_ASPC5|nr:hypothetical protein ASPCADRAFT_210938 [Aspergillus carbonarius ITEM 5010]
MQSDTLQLLIPEKEVSAEVSVGYLVLETESVLCHYGRLSINHSGMVAASRWFGSSSGVLQTLRGSCSKATEEAQDAGLQFIY